VQFLDLGSIERSKKLNTLLSKVRSTLRASHLGDEYTFRLFGGQQRAIGEVMITERGNTRGVMGYQQFCRAYWDPNNPSFSFWLQVSFLCCVKCRVVLLSAVGFLRWLRCSC